MEPAEKAEDIDKFCDSLLGGDRKQSIIKEKCVICKEPCPPESFRDQVSVKEFTISGMCQACQDRTFED